MGAKLSVPSEAIPEGRTFIVTGANAGIGYFTTKKIAQLGGTVVMACRSEEKANKAIEQMQEENRQEVRAKRKSEKEAADKERQRAEAAAAKEAQEKKREEERKKKEEEQKKAKEEQKAKEEEKAKEGEAPKEGEEKPAEGGEAATEGGEAGASEEGAKEETAPAEEEKAAKEKGQGDAEKAADEGTKEEGAKEEGAKEEGGADGDAPAEPEPEPEEEIPDLKVQFMQLDLESFQSVADFVKKFKESGLPLHVLICNGGLIAPSLVTTKDGLESTFQINYLSHFLLTLHLLPLLKASGDNPKVVNVASVIHNRAEGVNLDNIQSQKGYSQLRAYANSKLYQIMNMYSLSSKIKESGIDILSVHPGTVDSGFQKGYSGWTKIATIIHKGFGRNAQDGAATTLSAVLDEQYNGKGPLYFNNCKPAQPSNMSRNEEKQAILWRYSLELLREHVDDTILAEIGETLESIQPKEPEPAPEESAPKEGAATEGTKDAPAEPSQEEEKAEGDKPAEPSQEEEKTEGDKPAESSQEEEKTEGDKPAEEEKKDEE